MSLVKALVVGAELEAVAAGDRQGDLQRVDRIEAQPLPEQRRLRVDPLGGRLKMERLHDEARDLGLLGKGRRYGHARSTASLSVTR